MPASAWNSKLPEANAVLEFWLQDAIEHGWPSQSLGGLWFGAGAALDQDIDTRFGHLVREALGGGLAAWESRPLDRLALVILLDQFTRNVFRGQAQAFAGDERAQALATDAMASGWDNHLPLAGRVFLLMPLMHAEAIALQDDAVRHFKALLAQTHSAHAENLQGQLVFAQKHRDIIAAFGRFPHRNAALGRISTHTELEFLQEGPRFGQ